MLKELVETLRSHGYNVAFCDHCAPEGLGEPDATSGPGDWVGGIIGTDATYRKAQEVKNSANRAFLDLAAAERSSPRPSNFPPEISITGEGTTRYFIGLTAAGRMILRDVMPKDAGRFGEHYVIDAHLADAIARSLRVAGVCN